ncbi:MAG: aldo/keto reductase, partial [Pseudomonadota bacterium]
LAERLKPFIPPNLSMTQFALRWCLDFDAITTIIPGASSPEQARANAAISDLPQLERGVLARLRAFYASEVAQHIRGAV